MNLEQLRQALSALLNKMEALNSLCVNERNEVRAFSDDEARQYEELEAKSKTVREQIARLERQEELRGVISDLDAPVNTAPRIEVTRENNHNEDGEYRGYPAFERGGLGEFLKDVASATMNRSESPRLKEMRAALGSNTQVGSDGGFLIQSDHAEMLFTNAREAGEITKRCMDIPMTSNTTTLNMVDETSLAEGSLFGGVQAYWREEAGSVTATKPKFRREVVKLDSLDAVYYATEEQLEDASQLAAFVGKAFPTVMGIKLDQSVISGNGAGKPLGILNSPCTIAVAKEGGQAADTLQYANIDNMVDRLMVGSEERAIWLYHPTLRQSLRNMIKVGTNTDFLVYLPDGSAASQPHGNLFGYQAYRSQHAKAPGDLGDIMLLDLSWYALFRKTGIKASQSSHVEFLTSQMAFKWSLRVAGQPLLSRAVTDMHGSVTRSPFITLAERA